MPNPQWYDDHLRQIIDQSRGIANEPYQPYTFPRHAPPTPDMLKAWELNRGNLEHFKPYFKRGQELLESSARKFPEQAQEYMNPYQQQVVDNMRREAGRNFSEEFLPALSGRFGRTGQSRSSFEQKAALREMDIQQRSLAEQQARLMHQGYEHAGRLQQNDANRQAAAGLGISGLGQHVQGYNTAYNQQLNKQGAEQQNIAQTPLNMHYEDFQRQRQYPWTQLQNRQGILQGMPVQSQPAPSYQFQSRPNFLQQMGNVGAGMFGLNNALGGAQSGYGGFFKKGGQVRAKSNNKSQDGLSILSNVANHAKPKRSQKNVMRLPATPKMGNKNVLPKGVI